MKETTPGSLRGDRDLKLEKRLKEKKKKTPNRPVVRLQAERIGCMMTLRINTVASGKL